MNITGYSSKNYRNLKDPSFSPDSGINIIFGENGQGKTNMVESVWMMTGCHSFRTHKCSELISAGQKQARVKLIFDSRGFSNEGEIKISDKREFYLNKVPYENSRKFLGVFQAVVFSPSSLSIIQNAPSERRRFLDIAVSMTRPVYASHLIRYSKILANRNALLKQIASGKADENSLSPWDDALSMTGAEIVGCRLEYLKNISPVSSEIYKEISGGKEEMKVKYLASCKDVDDCGDKKEIADNIYESLRKNRENDIKRLMTSNGPHKDDLYITVGDRSARIYGSQGQQRSCALALKLSEADMIKKINGEYPVILLDDVMSELDFGRQKSLLDYLKNRQVFITCCDINQFSSLDRYASFKIENGEVKTG
ncbi:MAG: DNA replication/repair protein RecF [Clostridiales bacterium]|nr:DNA replication/repair protein RecF [Clostridiales bacterium]